MEAQGDRTRARILEFLRDKDKLGESPTIREIGLAVRLSSTSTVFAQLQSLHNQGKIVLKGGLARSVKVVKKREEICPCCNGNGWAPTLEKPENIAPQTHTQVREYRILGKFLNEDAKLIAKYRSAFMPNRMYRVRESVNGTEVLDLQDEYTGIELIGDTRPPNETSFGH